MPLEIVTVPCLSDNYAFLLHSAETGLTALVDAPEAAPIQAALTARGWTLDTIFLTHHHYDHIDGVPALKEAYDCKVIGAKADVHRLPPLDQAVQEGSALSFAGEKVEVFDVSGHTVGHIAFFFPDSGAAFTADSLMALGCGRLFEGTPDQMWESLSKLAKLPPDTLICSGHEYTTGNAAFAQTVDPTNQALQNRAESVAKARAEGKATVPSTLRDELATNPFLRAGDPAIRAHLNMPNASDAAVFAEIRQRKDIF